MHGASIVPERVGRKFWRYGGNQHYSVYSHYWFVLLCANVPTYLLHRHYNGKPTIPNQRYRGAATYS